MMLHNKPVCGVRRYSCIGRLSNLHSPQAEWTERSTSSHFRLQIPGGASNLLSASAAANRGSDSPSSSSKFHFKCSNHKHQRVKQRESAHFLAATASSPNHSLRSSLSEAENRLGHSAGGPPWVFAGQGSSRSHNGSIASKRKTHNSSVGVATEGWKASFESQQGESMTPKWLSNIRAVIRLGMPTQIVQPPQPPQQVQKQSEEKLDDSSPLPAVAWGALLLLSVAYMHQACNSFALPAMMPAISEELNLTDMQGALLTTGYSYLYALVLPPLGMLADRTPRPRLLALGVAGWSALTLVMSRASSFGDLMAVRIGLAATQAVQNPISFTLIPELFPQNKSAALALYNCAIYLGRALSFGAALAAEKLSKLSGTRLGVGYPMAGDMAGLGLSPIEKAASLIYVPIDKLDLSLVSILYTRGDYAAVMPNFSYQTFAEAIEAVPDVSPEAAQVVLQAAATQPESASWRQVMTYVGLPGFAIALAILFALPEPREGLKYQNERQQLQQQQQQQGLRKKSSSIIEHSVQQTSELHQSNESTPNLLSLLKSPPFMTTTLAASFNDVGSYALMAWMSTFYERVYHLEPSVYAPIIAVVLPIGGIIGGVGGGWASDRATANNPDGRAWITAGATTAAAPFMLLCLLAGDSNESFLALMLGFLLSEAWRAPAANMARSVAPAKLSSSAVSLYLCIRNLVGGCGPLGVALLTQQLGGDLQRAMLLIPVSYVISGALFLLAESQFKDERLLEAAKKVEVAVAAIQTGKTPKASSKEPGVMNSALFTVRHRR